MPANLIGPGGRLFADPTPGPDEVKFRQDNTSSAYYNSPYFTAHKNQVQPIPRRRNEQPLDLANFLPADVMSAIQDAGKISFHAVGDTGAAKVTRTQTAATAIGHETAVADAMVADVQGVNGPAFFFHLGDVIYNFGEAQYYYDQFYEPFRAYDRPIFAIPGNHDGMVFGQGSSAPQVPTLDAFLTNFCAADAGPSPDAGGLMRSVMTQPGVYFRLDAPFVSILGLYSNVLDSGPGVISSQGGHFPLVDDQLDFLKKALADLKAERTANNRAVIIAVHHPPLSADAKHGGSLGIMKDIDACCKAAGLYPGRLAVRSRPSLPAFHAHDAGRQGNSLCGGWVRWICRHHSQGAPASADHDRRPHFGDRPDRQFRLPHGRDRCAHAFHHVQDRR
jgi:hypothetical protein